MYKTTLSKYMRDYSIINSNNEHNCTSYGKDKLNQVTIFHLVEMISILYVEMLSIKKGIKELVIVDEKKALHLMKKNGNKIR